MCLFLLRADNARSGVETDRRKEVNTDKIFNIVILFYLLFE